MIIPRIGSLVAALVVIASADLSAQQVPPVAPGDRVRVTAWSIVPGRPVGTVVALGPDTCVVQLEGRAEPLALPLASVMRLEVSRGKRSNASRGALVGGLIGAGIGAFVGTCAWLGSNEHGFVQFGPEAVPAFAGVLGGAGAFVGLVLGAVSPSDRWEVVDLESVRVGLTPHDRRGLDFSVSVSF